MTLNQRLAEAKGWTARHVIQDEIAMFGKNSEVSEYQESKIKATELKDSARREPDYEPPQSYAQRTMIITAEDPDFA